MSITQPELLTLDIPKYGAPYDEVQSPVLPDGPLDYPYLGRPLGTAKVARGKSTIFLGDGFYV